MVTSLLSLRNGTFHCFPIGWFLWAEGEAGQAGLPASDSLLWDDWFARRSNLHHLGHPVLHPAARQHVFQLIWGLCLWNRGWESDRSNVINWCRCFFFFQSESFEVARIFSEAEARRVGCLLQISSEALQTVITHRVTVSSSAHLAAHHICTHRQEHRWSPLFTGDHLWQDILPPVCWKCHWIQVKKNVFFLFSTFL